MREEKMRIKNKEKDDRKERKKKRELLGSKIVA